jgi:oxalate decarboxylase/phosphoglucose isomerase-like protein (cupin superfamily)
MILNSERTLEGLKEVLQDPNSEGPKTAYWVYNKISNNKWENMTVITQGLYGKEFPKTYGHYHTSSNENEIYKLVSGSGIFLLQKKVLDEKNNLVENKVTEVLAVKSNTPEEEIYIPTEYAHSWSNIGKTPLITFDNWVWGHKDTDYLPIKKVQGMAYYIIQNNNKENGIEFIKNPKYIDVPEIEVITVKELNKRFSKNNTISSIV